MVISAHIRNVCKTAGPFGKWTNDPYGMWQFRYSQMDRKILSICAWPKYLSTYSPARDLSRSSAAAAASDVSALWSATYRKSCSHARIYVFSGSVHLSTSRSTGLVCSESQSCDISRPVSSPLAYSDNSIDLDKRDISKNA